jgi:hypothetical protein
MGVGARSYASPMANPPVNVHVRAAQAVASMPAPSVHVKTGTGVMGLTGAGEKRITLGPATETDVALPLSYEKRVPAHEAYERVVGDGPKARFVWDTTSATAGVLAVQIVAPLMSLPADRLYWFGAVVGGIYGRHIRRKPD